MDVFVKGIGVVGGFGSGMGDLASAVSRGKSERGLLSFDMEGAPAGIAAFLADTTGLERFVPKKSVRRIDHYSKMALLGSYLALEDAGELDQDNKGLGIVVASGYGASATTFAFLDSFITSNDGYSSPTHFSNSVHNAAAAHISILLGATGPCLTVSQFEMSVPSALISALRWLEEGRVERVLLGAVDECCKVLAYCWRRFFGSDPNPGPMEPFLFDAQSAVPGEGAAFFLLSRDKGAGGGYGRITGVEMRHGGPFLLPPHERTLFVLGADGTAECGPMYEKCITDGLSIASYTPLFGSFPAGMGLDMAVSCLSMKEKTAYGPPEGMSLPDCGEPVGRTGSLDAHRVCCLKFGSRGESGMVFMARDEGEDGSP